MDARSLAKCRNGLRLAMARVSPFGKPDDASWLQRPASWSIAASIIAASIGAMKWRAPDRCLKAAGRTYAAWANAGVQRARRPSHFRSRMRSAQMWVPVQGGPVFLLGPNFLRSGAATILQ